MMAVYENKEANLLIDIYSKEFRRLFGIAPIFDANNFHIGTFKDIAKSAKEQGPDLVKHFFKMKDDWFQKQGYTPECLKKHLPAIAIDHQKRVHLKHDGPIKVTTKYACDNCFLHFDLTCTIDFLYSEVPRRCPDCLGAQNIKQSGYTTMATASHPS